MKVPGDVKGGFALEAQVPLQATKVDLTFDFGAVKNGYGWVFPKGDHLNVGLGYYGGPADEKLNRERLVTYVRQRLGTDRVDHVVGRYLGVSTSDSACAYGRVLLAGDAAGLVDPLTAEGIYSAVVSGQAAASAINGALGEASSNAEERGSVDGESGEEVRGSAEAAARDPGIFCAGCGGVLCEPGSRLSGPEPARDCAGRCSTVYAEGDELGDADADPAASAKNAGSAEIE